MKEILVLAEATLSQIAIVSELRIEVVSSGKCIIDTLKNSLIQQ
jgi:hypothetical protein